MALIAAIALFAIAHTVQATDPDIVYKRVDDYDWIYDDHNTGARVDVSIWRPKNRETGYFAVGDVAVAHHGKPGEVAIMIKEVKAGTLAAPTGFTEIWNDRGSGGSHDVRIMRMDPPDGFTCVGHVAVLGYGSLPNANLYRCVANAYVTTGLYEYIWNDGGSGAHRDVSFWSNRVSESNTIALDANTFTSFATHNTPTGAPSMLDGNKVLNHQNLSPSLGSYIFTVYEVTDLDEIWNDKGSGADRDFSSWRSRGKSGTYSLGDIGVPYHGRPHRGFVVKAHKDDALKAAYDWDQVWNDRGSGADWDGAFWKPRCEPGYRGLGHVSMRNHWEKPGEAEFRCVKSEHTLGGYWHHIWQDSGSGADRDVRVWEARSHNWQPGQGVAAMSTIGHHGNMNVGAYVLKSNIVNYVQGKPVTKILLTNVRYNFDDRKVLSTDPESLARTILENHGDTVQQTTRDVSYTYEETYSWGNTAGVEIGVETEVTAGVPLVEEATITTSIKTSYSHEWGGSTTKSHTDTISVQTTVKPHSSKTAIIAGKRYKADVPYTADLVSVYHDGTRSTRNGYKGVYKGVQINEVRVVYEADVPLTSSSGAVSNPAPAAQAPVVEPAPDLEGPFEGPFGDPFGGPFGGPNIFVDPWEFF